VRGGLIGTIPEPFLMPGSSLGELANMREGALEMCKQAPDLRTSGILNHFMMRPMRLLVMIVATFGFGGAALALPYGSASGLRPINASLIEQTGVKCEKVDGKLVCGLKKKSDEKKKTKPEDTGLSECTIQGPNSGGGCKTGFKRVCEKLKSGKKCCGCVADKAAQTPAPAPVADKIEDQPCFELCSSKCGGPTAEAQQACVVQCLESTNCTRQ
jgi:hypothetical protein